MGREATTCPKVVKGAPCDLPKAGEREVTGTLLGKPEAAGMKSDRLLNGIARCSECGGAMSYMSKGPGRSYYYCQKALHA